MLGMDHPPVPMRARSIVPPFAPAAALFLAAGAAGTASSCACIEPRRLVEAHKSTPRATIYLAQAAKVHAFMEGRAYVTPQDVKTIGPDVLRHRVLLTYEAEAQDLDSDSVLRDIFNTVDVP